MKKPIIFVLILILALGASVLAGCGGKGAEICTAWATRDVLTYDIVEKIDGADVLKGEMTVEIQNLAYGEQVTLASVREEAFTVNEHFGNCKITMTAKDTADNTIMFSEGILSGWGALASYKQVNNGDTKYEVKGYYSDKKYHFSYNNGEWQSIKVKTGFMDNELVYTALRCQDLDSGYSTSYTMIVPENGTKETMSVSLAGQTENTVVHYTDAAGAKQTAVHKCVVMQLAKDAEPKGYPIVVTYTPYSNGTSSSSGGLFGCGGSAQATEGEKFLLKGNDFSASPSRHIPVEIVEGNVKYVLTDACANVG